MNIVVDLEFKSHIPSLSTQEREQLEKNITEHGCIDPLVVWQEEGILIDGHNRYEICTKLGIDFDTREMSFSSRDEVVDWMDRHQLGRRNLTPEQMSLIRGRIYNRTKKTHAEAGALKAKSDDHFDHRSEQNTSESLAQEFGVSAPTVRRDGKFVETVESLAEHIPSLNTEIMEGQAKRRDINEVAQVLAVDDEKPVEPFNSFEAAKEYVEKKKVHVSNNSGNNEWYTPAKYIELARQVMGSIDTDPATSEIANKTVQATTIYTAEDDGREKEWGGNVWMNPPYAQPLMADFAEGVTTRYEKEEIEQACILVNNATETQWFQRMLDAASAVCFPRSRIRFVDPDGNPSGAPLQGQAILYMGENVEGFKQAFSAEGRVLTND